MGLLLRPLSIPLRAWFAALLLLGLAGSAAAAEVLRVDARASIPVWPAVTVLADPGRTLNLEQVLARRPEFAAYAGTAANLGRVEGTVWLRVPLQVEGTEAVRRVLEIDYPTLNLVDVFVLRDNKVLASYRLGNGLHFDARPIPSRALAAPLTLAPGAAELLLRVQTHSSILLPMTLRTPTDFLAAESREQALLGMWFGIAACMLIYSLAHWVTLRDRVFLDYAVMLGGNSVFFLSYFGIGQQYLWPDWPQGSMHVAPLAVLAAAAAATGFARRALAVHETSPVIATMLRATGMAALASLAVGLTGWIDYRLVQSLATWLGLLCTGLMLPAAYVRARRGERVAAYMLAGWGFYVVGVAMLATLMRGHLEPTPLIQHIYPLAALIEMAVWMAVLGLRVQTIHRNADRTRVESETLRALAHTDSLTGLPNRRGLHGHLRQALGQCGAQRLLAVFLLDLDSFKPVNDRFGHDVGDALLVAVGQRLQAQMRGTDVVARLGGDEFVVLAGGLADEEAAQALGAKMLAAFELPFTAEGRSCQVGITIGYALAPTDGDDADDLLKRADAAMYAGKAAGRRCLLRSTPAPAPGLASAIA
jgi:diguanylate cyclase (GGDEF)-like protein